MTEVIGSCNVLPDLQSDVHLVGRGLEARVDRRGQQVLNRPDVVVRLRSVQGAGFRVQGSGFRVQGAGFRVQDSGFRSCSCRGRACE